MRRIVIVGPSGSGKTTISELLGKKLGLQVVSADDFRAKAHSTRMQYVTVGGKQVRNYESPRCWDAPAVASKLKSMTRRGEGFVAEGLHLLANPEILALDTERYYIDVPHAESVRRRTTRHRYLPADESFIRIGEQETARWVAPQRLLPGVVVFDGQQAVDWLVDSIVWFTPTPVGR